MKVSKNYCSYCKNKLINWDYRYKGKHYCRKCYDKLFHVKTCSVCKMKRKIYYALKIPICKFCQVKNKPCIRCKKTDYIPGAITKHGAICNSCAKYYRDNKICSNCKVKNTTVSNRTLLDGTRKLLCQKCYNKTLPTCSSCRYRRKPYSYLISNKKPLCKICSTEVDRKCKICNNAIPAGWGNICSECSNQKTLNKKVDFIRKTLSSQIAIYFYEFSIWLKARRGVLFTANHIQNYQVYFYDINKLYTQNNKMPTYKKLLTYFPKATSNKYRLVNSFLAEKNLIHIDRKLKEEFADYNLIEKYLNVFNKNDYRYKIIQDYYRRLKVKLSVGKITIKSLRLALTPAIKYLKYCGNFPNLKPNTYSLEGYLWCSPGQKSSITEFVNFLQKNYNFKISIKDIAKPTLTTVRESQGIMKQRLIKFLRNQEEISIHKNYFLKVLFGCFHRIYIPDNIFIDIKTIKKKNKQDYYIRLCREDFYMPKYIVNILMENFG